MRVGRIDLDELKKDKEQLWAEAVHLFKQGTPWHVSAEEYAIFKEEQEKRYIGDAYEDAIRAWLDGDGDTPSEKRMEVTTQDILGKALALERSRWTLAEQQRVGRIMSRIGWEKKRARRNGKLAWVYVRPQGGDGGRT